MTHMEFFESLPVGARFAFEDYENHSMTKVSPRFYFYDSEMVTLDEDGPGSSLGSAQIILWEIGSLARIGDHLKLAEVKS